MKFHYKIVNFFSISLQKEQDLQIKSIQCYKMVSFIQFYNKLKVAEQLQLHIHFYMAL